MNILKQTRKPIEQRMGMFFLYIHHYTIYRRHTPNLHTTQFDTIVHTYYIYVC